MFKSLRTISTVLLFGLGFAFASTAVVVEEASAERKGYKNQTYDW